MKSQDFAIQPVAENHHEPDHEVNMAKRQLYFSAKAAIELHKVLADISEQQGLEGWVQSKITKAYDYLIAVHDHLVYQETVAEPPGFTFESAEVMFKDILEMSAGATGAGAVALGGASMRAPKMPNPFKRKKIKEQVPAANVAAPAGTTTTAAPAVPPKPGTPAPAAGAAPAVPPKPGTPAPAAGAAPAPGQPPKPGAPAGTMTPPNPMQVKKDQDTLASVLNNPASPLNAQLQALIKQAASLPK
jgi:hypothetical protein